MAQPERQFRQDHGFRQAPPPAPEVPVPGRRTLVSEGPITVEGMIAQQLRTAIGAFAQLRNRLLPALDAAVIAQQPDEMAMIDARAALLRAEAALAQADSRRAKVTSPEIEQLWQQATTERDAVAPRVLAFVSGQDNVPSADTKAPTPAPLHQAPKVPAQAPPETAKPPPTVQAPAEEAYAPTWTEIANAAAGDKKALAKLDVEWIDALAPYIVASIDGGFHQPRVDERFQQRAAYNPALRKLDAEHKKARAKLDAEEAAAKKAADKAAKDAAKAAKAAEKAAKADPQAPAPPPVKPPDVEKIKAEYATKRATLDKDHETARAKAVGELRTKFDAEKHGLAHQADVTAPPKEGGTNDEGRMLARANFMAWGIDILGSAAAVKKHFKEIESVGGGFAATLFLWKPASDRLKAAKTWFEQKYPGNTFFNTDVGWAMRGVHHEQHGLGYLGHALGISIDFQAYRNPSFLNVGRGDIKGSAQMHMLKRWGGGTDKDGKRLDGTPHIKLPTGGMETIRQIGEVSANGGELSKEQEDAIDKIGAAYDQLTKTSDNFKASQAANMADLRAAKASWIQVDGALKAELKAAEAKVVAARQAATAELAKDKTTRDMKKEDRDALIAGKTVVVEAVAARAKVLATIETEKAKVEAAIKKAFGPWVKELQAEVDDRKKPAKPEDLALAKSHHALTYLIKRVRAMTKREELVKVLEGKEHAAKFDVATLSKITDAGALKAAMLERLEYLRGINPEWAAGEIRIREVLIAQLTSPRSVFGNAKSYQRWVPAPGGKGKVAETVWTTEKDVNVPPVMQLLEDGFASQDALATGDGKGRKTEVFNREFVQAMARFGFNCGGSWEGSIDTMHFDFMQGFSLVTGGRTEKGDFSGDFGPKPNAK
jgi:hypothetical protein